MGKVPVTRRVDKCDKCKTEVTTTYHEVVKPGEQPISTEWPCPECGTWNRRIIKAKEK